MSVKLLIVSALPLVTIQVDKLNGVTNTEVGYCGGNSDNTNYKEVCSGKTNHAEVIRIEFDNTKVSYEKILNYFFEIHDPTALNRQGPDIGTQYRSEIFYINEVQKKIAENILIKNNKKYKGKIVTKISELKNYCKAEDNHQKYIQKNSNVYC